MGASGLTAPLEPGWETSTPKHPSGRGPAGSATTSVSPSGSARVASTASVWGWVSGSATNTSPAFGFTRWTSAIASAAAVASSSIEALASSVPVSSATIVWKLSTASSRPWEISG